MYSAGTITKAAVWREKHCGPNVGFVYGFDTFTGLPELWRGDFKAGSFDLKGNLPQVRGDIKLVKGMFNESLPPWLVQQDKRYVSLGNNPLSCTWKKIDCNVP